MTIEYTFSYEYHKHYVEVDAPLEPHEIESLNNMLSSFPHANNLGWIPLMRATDYSIVPEKLLKIAANAYDSYGNTVLGVVAALG